MLCKIVAPQVTCKAFENNRRILQCSFQNLDYKLSELIKCAIIFALIFSRDVNIFLINTKIKIRHTLVKILLKKKTVQEDALATCKF